MGAAFVRTVQSGVVTRMNSPLEKSLTPYFRRMASEAMSFANRGEVSERNFVICPHLSVTTSKTEGGSGFGTTLIHFVSRTHGHRGFIYDVAVESKEEKKVMMEAFEEWVEAAPVEAARHITSTMSSYLAAGATVDDLVFAVANAVASAVIDS